MRIGLANEEKELVQGSDLFTQWLIGKQVITEKGNRLW